jgi:hypothetical protein
MIAEFWNLASQKNGEKATGAAEFKELRVTFWK